MRVARAISPSSSSRSSESSSVVGDEGGEDPLKEHDSEAGEEGGVYNFSQRIGNMERRLEL